MNGDGRVLVATSVPLVAAEQRCLTDAVAGALSLRFATGSTSPLPALSTMRRAEAPDGTWYADIGLDPLTIFALAIAPLPAFFLKSMAEEAGKRFLQAVVEAYHRLGKRKTTVPLTSFQVSFGLDRRADSVVDIRITVTSALHWKPESLAAVLQRC